MKKKFSLLFLVNGPHLFSGYISSGMIQAEFHQSSSFCLSFSFFSTIVAATASTATALQVFAVSRRN